MAKAKVRLAIGIALCALFLDAMAFGSLLPVLPDFLRLVGMESETQIAVSASILLLTFAVFQFLFVPVMSALSDRFGRRAILIPSMLGLGFDYAIMSVTDSIVILTIARAVSGGLAATYAVAIAIAADCVPPEKRASIFGLASGAIGAGFVFGPGLGGILGEVAIRLPMIVSSTAFFAVAVIAYFFLPETLDTKDRRTPQIEELIPFVQFAAIRHDRSAIYMLVAVFVIFLSSHAYFSLWPFYATDILDWGIGKVGLSMTIYGCLLAVVSAVLVGPAEKLFGSWRLACLSLLPAIISFLGLAVAIQDVPVYSFLILGGLSAATVPAIQATLSPRFGADRQGQLQGLVASMQSLGAIVGPPVMFAAFASPITDKLLGGFIYLIGAAGLSIGLLLLLAARPSGKHVRAMASWLESR
ncbi:MFS transporter [Blastomonas aquatica]|uniref:Tetracycline resistance MFS efflux pump n=1 Tax=Blastomonas aquatica TaxID=1510276 RepID=A0ABQ1J7A9_9SPHN|nr:MFS transporter [Blastomonas aquatica]GGB61746.1 tetracycline resistance MFS efflux pump [Blastomonas aquatica]